MRLFDRLVQAGADAGQAHGLLVEALAPPAPLTRAEQAVQIAGELRCPDCQALSVAESQTAAAAAIPTLSVPERAGARGGTSERGATS